MRLAWLHTKFADEVHAARERGPHNEIPFVVRASSQRRRASRRARPLLPLLARAQPLPYIACSPEALRVAHAQEYPFRLDGLVFVAKDGPYVPGASPVSLHWKDERTSRFLVDAGEDGAVGARPQRA